MYVASYVCTYVYEYAHIYLNMKDKLAIIRRESTHTIISVQPCMHEN